LRRPICDPSKQWVVEFLARWNDFVPRRGWDAERSLVKRKSWWNMMMSESHTHTHALTHVTQRLLVSSVAAQSRHTGGGDCIYLDLACDVGGSGDVLK
jgi:hypothetical protein